MQRLQLTRIEMEKPSTCADFTPPVVARAIDAPLRAERTAIASIMERSVVSVAPDLTVSALMALLLEWEIGGAPVVDSNGVPLGVVSKSDVVRVCNGGANTSELRVREIMMPLSFSLTESASIARAAALMAFEGVHRIIVIGMTGEVVGILSSLDVMRWLARESGYVVRA